MGATIAVIGLGRIGAFHAETLSGLAGVDELVVTDERPEVTAAVADKLGALVSSADGRHFFTYFRQGSIQRPFAQLGLSGDLAHTGHDYIGVFTQNLNGSKVDYWQRRSVASTVRQTHGGEQPLAT